MAMLSPEALEARFLAWVSDISERLGVELVHIDGKTARGSYDPGRPVEGAAQCQRLE